MRRTVAAVLILAVMPVLVTISVVAALFMALDTAAWIAAQRLYDFQARYRT